MDTNLEYEIESQQNFDIYSYAKIYEEWVIGSGVDPAIVELNVIPLQGVMVYEYLATEHSKRLNTGRLASNLLKRYELAADYGGWWVAGVDPITGKRMQWGQFKPNTPRQDIQKDKPIKYEAPDGVLTRAFFLEVPRHIWELISNKYDCPIDDSLHFWQWVIKNNLPITICEGAKKAGALLTIGIIAIAISGVYNATRKLDSDERELIPDLQHFATTNRKIFSCFDTDRKAKTRAYVAKASKLMLKAFDNAGCEAKFISLPSDGDKVGADDFIVKNGGEKFHELYKYARNWCRYKGFLGFAKALFTPKPQTSKPKLTPPSKPQQAEYKAGVRLQALQKALRRHKFVLVGDQVGFGKSTFIGGLNAEDLNAETIYYFSPSHRNPTTPEVAARFIDLPVRNNGLFEDQTKLINGSPQIRWPQRGEQPNLPGNCIRTEMFHELARKGYNNEIRQTSESNPICQTCPFKWNCKGVTLDGTPTKEVESATFRRDRKAAMAAPLIRASIESLAPFEPDPNADPDAAPKTTYENVLVIDELSQVTGVETQVVTKTEVDLTIAELAKAGVYDQFKWVGQLRELLDENSRYGLDNATIFDQIALNQISDDEYLGMLEALNALTVNLLDELALLAEADGVDLSKMGQKERKEYRASFQSASKHLAREQLSNFRQYIDKMIPNWLGDVLKALRSGSLSFRYLRIKHGQLIITKPDFHVRELMRSADKIIILDATATVEDVIRKLGADRDEVTAIRQELPKLSNLNIIQITGMGHLGKQRSDDKVSRVDALKAEFSSRHTNFGSIDIKACKNEGEGHWGYDNRGSNEYKNCDGLFLVGDPYKDIGAMKAQWEVLQGIRAMMEYSVESKVSLDDYIAAELSDDNFQAFISADVANEVIQGVGRTRPYNREDQITVYIASDSDNRYLHLAFPGATIKTTTAFEITPHAGDRVQRLKWNILEAARKLHSAGQKINAVAITNSIGCHKSRISQICAEYGGSKRFLKSLITLLKALYRDIKLFDSSNLDDDDRWFAQNFLPTLLDGDEDTRTEALELVISYGGDLEALLGAIPTEYKAKLLIEFIKYLPIEIFNGFGMRLHGIA